MQIMAQLDEYVYMYMYSGIIYQTTFEKWSTYTTDSTHKLSL